MKKTIGILVLILVCCALTSCNSIKEPKIKGELIGSDLDSELSVERYINNYYDEKEKGLDLFDQWYKIKLQSKINLKSEEEGYNIETNIKLNGKILDAEYDFEEKGVINYTIEMNGTVPASSEGDVKSELSLKFDIKITIIEGKTYVKALMKGNVDKNSFKFKLKTNIDYLEHQLDSILGMTGSSSEMIGSILDLDIFSRIFQLLSPETILDDLNDSLKNDNTSIYVHKNQYTTEYRDLDEEEEYVEITSFELDDYNYQLLSYEEYVKDSYVSEDYTHEMITYCEIKTALFGNVKEPLDKANYVY